MELDYIALGKRIRALRKEKHLSQVVLAKAVGIEASNISHIENATSKVSLGTLVRIANALEMRIDDLLCDSVPAEQEAFESELSALIEDCTPYELRMICDTVASLKESFHCRKKLIEKPQPKAPEEGDD